MQFLMVPVNGAARVRGWEAEFEDVLAYIESLPAPRWPFALDRGLATRGRPVFERACASCHGTYGDPPTYPLVDVPIDTVGTDRLRHDAVATADRATYGDSWFTGYDPSAVHTEPEGYVAPPLDGVFASAPYFHNGAVPTLWHVLHPDARPAAWTTTSRRSLRRDAGRARHRDPCRGAGASRRRPRAACVVRYDATGQERRRPPLPGRALRGRDVGRCSST